MHNYKGQLRREPQDYTPTKSSWERGREAPQPPPKYEPKYDKQYEQRPQEKYDTRYDNKYDTKYDKSEISYYPSESQGSRVLYEYDRSERQSTRSQAVLADDHFLFNEVMPVRIKSYEREQFEPNLRVQVQTKNQKGISNLLIFLTDDANPKFLWTFNIKESDFMTLKNEQKLKVSYSGFPEMLQNCFKECTVRQGNNIEGRKNHLFLQILKGGDGYLNFLQSNRYKESVHLLLKFRLANDQQIKDHLSGKLLSAQQQNDQNRITISKLQNVLSDRRRQIQIKDAEMRELMKENQRMVNEFKIEEREKLQDINAKNSNQMTKYKRESEEKLQALRDKYNTQIQELTKNKNQLNNKLSQARQKIANYQSNQREQAIKIARLQNDLGKYLKQSDQLKQENRDLSQKRFQNQKTITELSCKIQSLRSQLQDKKTIITSTVQLKETNNSQITALEQQNADQKKQLLKYDTKISELQGQVSRLSSSNQELLQKIARQKEKLQERAQIIKQQQKEVKQLKRTQMTLNRQNQDYSIRCADKQARIKSIQQQLQLCQKKLQDQSAMVVYLQKNLNQRPALRTPTYLNNSYQSSSAYMGVNRDGPSQISSTSNVTTSRIALTSNINRDRPVDRTEKYQPNIKRYEDRSKSPISKRPPVQQREPDDDDGVSEKLTGFDQPRPVKFKMSQPSRESQK